MLDLARRFGQDPVFVLPPEQNGDVCMRYFVPDHEMGVSVNADVEARQFPLRAGFLEDAATSVAAAALEAYLARYDLNFVPGVYRFDVAQGYAMGAPSLIHVIIENGGDAVVRTAIHGSAQIIPEETV
jgi:predicted PhzF superfamily epimerase YddE/YHI9